MLIMEKYGQKITFQTKWFKKMKVMFFT